MKKTYVLGILDGWGVTKDESHNAISAANPITYNHLLKHHPNTLLEASGSAVGLPDGQMGNSEVGHLTIGSGRIIYQDFPRINNAILSGEFSKKLDFIKEYHRKNPKSRCHIVGMISDGGVHSHIDHIISAHNTLSEVPTILHAISDGRDVLPRSCLKYLKSIKQHNIYIGTISGRYYAMDRDNRNDRTELCYNAMLFGEGKKFKDPLDYINEHYTNSIDSDEFIKPAVNHTYHGVHEGDTILILNFRADRVRQLIHKIIYGDNHAAYSHLIGLTHYSDAFNDKIVTLFDKERHKNTLGELISAHKMTQLRLAETEKYAHVTYFFNGGAEQAFQNEERILIPSPDVATYDLKPEMSIIELTQSIIEAITSKKYNFICFNFANADMVGHTGNFIATIQAIKAIDESLAKIYDAIIKNEAELILTADHGNAEAMYNEAASSVHTSHTLNKVPLIYVGSKNIKLKKGGLMDIAPTILDLMSITKPKEMSGISLIV